MTDKEKRQTIGMVATVIAIVALCGTRGLIPLNLRLAALFIAFVAPATFLVLDAIGVWGALVAGPTEKRKRYFVYGDLTPFWDRWGQHHTRAIGVTRFYRVARIKAWLWTERHRHGSAFVSPVRLHATELWGKKPQRRVATGEAA